MSSKFVDRTTFDPMAYQRQVEQERRASSSSATSSNRTATLPFFGANRSPRLSAAGNSGHPKALRSASSASRQFEGFDDEGQEDEGKSAEKIKVKMMSIWNNVKYGWSVKIRTSFSYETPIWFLGTLYHKNLFDSHSHPPSEADHQRHKETAMEKFKQDYYSRIWLTYRRDFPKIAGSQFTTDCGWGCMLRSGQMMLAQAFIAHYLGRKWRWGGSQSDKNDMIHRMIIKWFLDEPNSAFSVHQLVKIGQTMGKKPGEWYGPATVSHIIQQALWEAFADNPILEDICSYVAQDCTVYIQDVVKLCTEDTSSHRRISVTKKEARSRAASHSSSITGHEIEIGRDAVTDFIQEDEVESFSFVHSQTPRSSSFFNSKASSTFNLYDGNMSSITSGYTSGQSLPIETVNETSQESRNGSETNGKPEKWRGIIIFIPVRLGGEKFNPVYTHCVKALFSHQSCIGIIGGRPRHSLFFVGCQEDKLIYLDPHFCQDAVDMYQINFPLRSFHCMEPRKMPITKMDPSCTLAFYCRTKQDFLELTSSVKEFIVPDHRHTDYPIFVFAEGSSSSLREATCDYDPPGKERLLQVRHRYINAEGEVEAEAMGDEFVVI